MPKPAKMVANPGPVQQCCPGLSRHLRPELFRALADPTRLTVLGRLALARRPLTVSEVADCCGVHLSGVSRHLGLLRQAGIVVSRREGREVRYELDRSSLCRALRSFADALEGAPSGDK